MTDIIQDFGALEPHSPYCRWHEQREEMLKELWAAGVHHEKIAEQLGVTSQSVIAKAGLMKLPSRGSPEWPDDRVDHLKQLWADGLSASECANVLGNGITRNAVIGKVHRLKLPPRATRLPTDPERAKRRALFNDRRRTAQTVTRMRTPKVQKFFAEPEPVPEALHLSLLELNKKTCHFPFGDGPYTFCGRPTVKGSSYCLHCYRVTHMRPQSSGGHFRQNGWRG